MKYYECLHCEAVFHQGQECSCDNPDLAVISKDEYMELTDQNIVYDRT